MDQPGSTVWFRHPHLGTVKLKRTHRVPIGGRVRCRDAFGNGWWIMVDDMYPTRAACLLGQVSRPTTDWGFHR